MQISGKGKMYHSAVAFKEVSVDLESRELLGEIAEHIIRDTGLSIVETHWLTMRRLVSQESMY